MSAREMEAEREMDIRVAVDVMGWTPAFVNPAHPYGKRLPHGSPEQLDFYDGPAGRTLCGWSPSIEIDAAWEVVAELRARGFNVVISCSPSMRSWDVRGWKDDNSARFIAHADTAPLAICRAALAAIEDAP